VLTQTRKIKEVKLSLPLDGDTQVYIFYSLAEPTVRPSAA